MDYFDPNRDEHHDMIRSWLKLLKDYGIPDGYILKNAGCTISHTTLSRFRDKTTGRLTQSIDAEALWNFIRKKYSALIYSHTASIANPTATDYFFNEITKFLDVKDYRIPRIGTQFYAEYQIFTRSNIFWDHEAVSVSDLIIDIDPKSLTRKATNKIRYNKGKEKFGAIDLDDDFEGVVVPKSRRYIIMLRNKIACHPRIYFINHGHIGKNSKKFDFLFGQMVKHPTNDQGSFFWSKFVARNLMQFDRVEPDLYRKNEITDPFILDQLFDDDDRTEKIRNGFIRPELQNGKGFNGERSKSKLFP